MAVPRKLVAVPNSATRDLWRIVESGEMDQLEAVLPQADINARNEHGVTALMRAAYHGRVQMVRMLLEHGADPNLMRNDKFTALSIAAFFGHTEIVDMLVQHGANTDASTRFGTSPRMWARARSFGDVARCLEKKRSEHEHPVKQPVVPTPAAPTPPAPVAVRTLKDPPEIWDLVHEEPEEFKPGLAFIGRVGSTKRRLAVPVTALLVAVGIGIGAAVFLKNKIWISTPAAATTTTPAATTTVVNQPAETNIAVQPAPAPASTTTTVAAPVENAAVVNEPAAGETRNPIRRRPPRPAGARVVSTEALAETETVQATAPPVIAPPKIEPRTSVQREPKKTAGALSPQLISPSKNGQPKAKVIQWP